MKTAKAVRYASFVALCLAMNIGGRLLSVRLELPLWLDVLGTTLCAAVAGPMCGGLVGLTSNIGFMLMSGNHWIYCLTNVALAVVVSHAVRRGALETLFSTVSVGVTVSVVATAVSVVLNMIFFSGVTGNPWGDAVTEYLQILGAPRVLSYIIGQFYLEFLDKLLALLAVFVILKVLPGAVSRVKPDPIAEADAVAAAIRAKAGTIAVILLALCLPLTAPARAEVERQSYSDYVQTVYSSKNGLPCGEANDIAQTNDGILWIGTYAGLYRYNGREFRWMSDFDSVRNVNCLYVDGEGRLWIGSNDNGLSIAINEEIVNVVDQSKGLPSNSVRSIIQGADGYYYVGTTGSLQVLSLSDGLKQHNTLREINYADNMAADEAGHVAAVTSDGRVFLLSKGQILSSRQLTDRNEIFRSCGFGRDGHLLAGTSAGRIYEFDISEGSFDIVRKRACGGLTTIKDLYLLENGEVFISADNGVGYIDISGKYHSINTNNFNNSIDNMLMDYQGNLWFTSSRLGLLRLAPSAFSSVFTSAGLSPKVVNAVVKWQGNYYIGTDKGLDVVDNSCHYPLSRPLANELDGTRIRCMLVDSDYHLWICTYSKGLLEVAPDGTQYRYTAENSSVGNRARLVTQLRDGTIVAASDTGISYIRDHRVVRTVGRATGFISPMILTVTELPDGRLLAGTDGEGIAVLKDGQVTGMLTRENGLSSGVILRTVPDPKGEGVFIVTSNGLCFMDSDDQIRQLDNFPYFNNYNLWARDEDTLFVMSSAGIYVVDRDELLSGAEEIGYDVLDGRRGLNGALTANAWCYYDDSNGTLFLPCDTGVFAVNVDRYASGSQSFRMMIPTIRADNVVSRLEHGGRIDVGRSVGKIDLFPEIINYTILDPFIGYWLEGFDSGWTILPQSSLNSISYTNLPPGNYTFHMAVFDSSQQVMLSERTYELVKEQELYDSPVFKVYMLLVPMIAAIWLSVKLARVRMQRTLEAREKELALARQQVQMGNETIIAIAKAVDAKDERTSQHSFRVSQYSEMIARELGFSDEDCESIRRAALMHDIGKIGIPDAILNKPARLTDDEYEVMKSHTLRGAEILKDFTLIDHVVEGALHHHERYDGRGYPNHMAGEQIPVFARIIGVADAFDAMTANRVYRRQMDFGYVMDEMRKGRGSQFDPQFVDILLKLIETGKIDLNELYKAPAERPAQG
ncbi:MAG: HD domain-containing protein [Clostridia bacterium]|nr:HD domain-containing protein [Clostridia bacterium]